MVTFAGISMRSSDGREFGHDLGWYLVKIGAGFGYWWNGEGKLVWLALTQWYCWWTP